MYISCLATDYNCTLVHDGVVEEAILDALLRSGGPRSLSWSLGESFPTSCASFPQLDLFDRVVAKSGALLFKPAEKRETPLAPRTLRRVDEVLPIGGKAERLPLLFIGYRLQLLTTP